MTVKSLKISGWDIAPAQANDGEENAVVVSFRLSNIIGVDYFVKLFRETKKGIEGMEGFNAIGLGVALFQFGKALYENLKAAKNSAKSV